MKNLTLAIKEQGFADRLLNEHQIARIVGGSPQRRYGLVNRALKAGELIRVQRGLYMLAGQYRDAPYHPYHIAQGLFPSSYISLETALAYHGWIPEAVYETASILPGRKSKELKNEQFGKFTFHPLATNRGYFLELVERVQINKQTMLIAKPIRALMDLVCYKKVEWQGIDWIEKGLRIDLEYLRSVPAADIRTLKLVYKQKRVKVFLAELEKALNLEQGEYIQPPLRAVK
ncbi:MAG: hypothetical protein V7711_17075 [Pseudomonadales bacterium]